MKKQYHLLNYLKFKKVLICLPSLEKLANAKTDKERKKLISDSKDCVIDAISEIALNCLNENIPLKSCDFDKLVKYKNILRKLSSPSTIKTRKRIINQNGGFLSILIRPAISLIAGLLGSYIGKKIRQ